MKPSPTYAKLMSNLLTELTNITINEDVPVGAIITDENWNVIAKAFNNRIKNYDPTGHAEIIAIRMAGKKLKNWRLDDLTIFVTLEPCLMCTGAILQSRLKRVVFGAYEPKTGGLVSQINSNRDLIPEVVPGVMEKECSTLISNWFLTKR